MAFRQKSLTCLDLGWVERVVGGVGVGGEIKLARKINSKLQRGMVGVYFCVGLMLGLISFMVFFA